MPNTEMSVYTAPTSLTEAVIPQNYVHPGLSLAQVLSIILAYRKQTLLIALAVFLMTILALKVLPKTYSATATLMVNYEVNDPLAGREFPIGLLGNYMSTQIELIQSPEVLLPVVDRLKLTQNRTYTSGYRGSGSHLREWAGKILLENLLIEQGHYGSQLIYITYSADNPAEASQVANAVAEIYLEQQYQRRTGPASDRATRYTAQVDELKSKAVSARDRLTEFRQRTGLIDSDTKYDVDITLLSTLQERLLEAQNARRTAETRSSGNQSVASEVLSSPLVQALKTQLAVQESRMAELLATLGPRHPQMLELQSQMGATRRSLAAAMQSYSGNASLGLSAARQMEQKLQQAVDEQHAKVLTVRKLQDEAAKYQVELDSAQAVYKRALDGYDQIMFASSDHYTNISFVSHATAPLKASKPKVLRGLLLGLIAGLLLGFAGPLCYELLHRRVRCRDDLERDHGIPVLVEFDSFPLSRSTS